MILENNLYEMFLSEWREFPSAPCLTGGKKNKKKLGESSRLDVVEITCRLTYSFSDSVTRKDLSLYFSDRAS
jgi:hypothetical protein